MARFCMMFLFVVSLEARSLPTNSPCGALDAYPSLVIPNFYGAFPLVAVISGPIELATAPVLPFPVITIAIVAPFSSFTPDYSKTAPFPRNLPSTEFRKIEQTVSKETHHYSATSQRQTGFPIKNSHKDLKNRKSAHKNL